MKGDEEEEWNQEQDFGLIDIYGKGPVTSFAPLEYTGNTELSDLNIFVMSKKNTRSILTIS